MFPIGLDLLDRSFLVPSATKRDLAGILSSVRTVGERLGLPPAPGGVPAVLDAGRKY
ncbi:MAG: hypothetical protein P9M08_08555 [Candidatus Erginobacter occultus]|nr:hypothetical protein [Candidatus Erginobacter occultus]